MKQLKSFLKILVILLLVTQNSFASVKPISGIGIVVKKNPHGSAEVMQTGDNGGFSMQLEAGEYELSFPQNQLKSVINSIIARNYPKSTYRYDGSGVELTINNPEIIVMLKPAEGNIYTIEAQNSRIIITVPRDGTTLSGILGWNDAVMKNLISCPDGFVMQNGECVPKINDLSQNRGIDKKDIRRKALENSSDKTNRKGWDGTVKGGNKTVENTNDETQRKGWGGSVKGKNIAEKGITENGLKKNELETVSDGPQKIAIKEQGVKKSDIETASDGTQKMAIKEQGVKKSEIEDVTNEAELKQIAETLVNFRKGWDGSIKGNKVENAANEADVKAIAETLVNLARKGWDGSIKGNKIENATKEADVKTITETLVKIRKGWDGSIKGNKVENVANESDVKAITEAFVNLRKGWDGSIKGNIMANVGPKESDDNIESIHIKITIITKVGFTDCESPGSFFCIGVEVGIGALHNNQNLVDLSLEKDQIISKTNVELMNGNIIKVTSTGVKSTISEKTMSEFANKTQKNKEFTLDKNVLNEICKALHLNTPNEPVIFRAEDQKYEVINTKNGGKEVQILEINQKTKIKIDGKEYTLSMLTTSGKS